VTIALSALEKTENDLEMTPSPQCDEGPSNGVDLELAALSMAEIASCSYEARYLL